MSYALKNENVVLPNAKTGKTAVLFFSCDMICRKIRWVVVKIMSASAWCILTGKCAHYCIACKMMLHANHTLKNLTQKHSQGHKQF